MPGERGVALPERQHAELGQGLRISGRELLPELNRPGDIAALFGGQAQLAKCVGIAQLGRTLPCVVRGAGLAERLPDIAQLQPAGGPQRAKSGAARVGRGGSRPFLLEGTNIARQTAGSGI